MSSNVVRLAAMSCLAFTSACQRGGGGSTAPGASVPFRVVSIDFGPTGVVQLNRSIAIVFSRPLDFASISASTIAIRDGLGAPAVGEFRDADPRTVVFQPRCPLLADLSDSGLCPGDTYTIELPGLDQGAVDTVRATDGSALAFAELYLFDTPANGLPSTWFFDLASGPPRAVVRSIDSNDAHASHIEIGCELRAYFERDAAGAVTLEPALELPLNLHSDLATRIAFVLAFDQSLFPSADNLARIALEFRGDGGAWELVASQVELIDNCAEHGALVRIEPQGVLPPDCELRAVLRVGLSDLTGEVLAQESSDFALARTGAATSPVIDEVLEDFLSTELEDAMPTFAEPRARWGGGELAPALGVDGHSALGGPGGDFDWLVPSGAIVLFDTTQTTLTGGPGFAPTTQQVATGGVIEVRNLKIAAGATVRVQGPNPLLILASGEVTIEGVLDVSGVSKTSVVWGGYHGGYGGPRDAVVPTSAPPYWLTQPGAPGVAGGGDGGGGHMHPPDVVEFGDDGEGAFGDPGRGGKGGETGWSFSPNIDAQRGAGGGGGRFAADVANSTSGAGAFDQRRIGLDAEPGFPNLQGSNGAVHAGAPPQGGATGALAFCDGDVTNDFFGVAVVVATGTRRLGELSRPWAGSGGGGGGDATRVWDHRFPPTPGPYNAKHGGGGGGGGGSVRIVALGRIRFGASGRLLARGGTGGGGDNTSFLNRVGGAGGGGSGGHVILESASRIEFAAQAGTNVAVLATGGQGGAGAHDLGGAHMTNSGMVETTAINDACPPGYPLSGLNACKGHVDGAGGDGGPGVIQLHLPRGLDDIVLPPGKTLADLCQPPPVCDWGDAHLVPSVALRSRARSRWIALGRGGFDASTGVDARLDFEFGGTDPGSGRVIAIDGDVPVALPLLGPSVVQVAPHTPSIGNLGRELLLDASPWLATRNAHLLERLELLRHTTVVLRSATDPGVSQRFDVAAAELRGPALIALTVDGDGPRLDHFAPGGAVEAALHPAWLRVATDGVDDWLPEAASVRIGFQATGADALGRPDENAATEPLYDVALLDWYAALTDLRYVRFEVVLTTASDPGAPAPRLPSLDFLRLGLRW